MAKPLERDRPIDRAQPHPVQFRRRAVARWPFTLGKYPFGQIWRPHPSCFAGRLRFQYGQLRQPKARVRVATRSKIRSLRPIDLRGSNFVPSIPIGRVEIRVARLESGNLTKEGAPLGLAASEGFVANRILARRNRFVYGVADAASENKGPAIFQHIVLGNVNEVREFAWWIEDANDPVESPITERLRQERGFPLRCALKFA